ncbi:MAG: 30S ribosomal protein S12 methylthiotransferase RimO [Candidatus Omnitrophica bacterium]|nr:30S ribosomal protein S12 methylthiotransferase RimO [Candidatus Omnitrophota bacterium]MCM8777227.1 30S ribosomal protein S12 methylthiotransferase RimO [Candidatus Omnitrophota bacterium]
MKYKKLCLITLGCPKNLVDSETILALLGQEKYILTNTYRQADIIVINTCGFIKDAVDESIGVVKRHCRKKRKGQKIVVYGCLVNRYKDGFPSIKGVDMLVEGGSPPVLINAIKTGFKKKFISGDCFCVEKLPRLISTYPYAYLKVSDGCNNFCSYCLIPKIRGNLRSRSIEDIVKEAESLEKMGIKEVILIAQDTGNYGRDIKGMCLLDKLLAQLCRYRFHWIRVMYMHPAHLTDSVLETIAVNKNICRYLDIPLQHIHPDILKKMNRPLMDYSKLIDRIRKAVPDIKLRTTFIVGFPGEKEEHFRMLVDFIKEKEFDRLGVFRYSREEGTPAFNLNGALDEETKKEREKIVMEIQRKISRKKLQKMMGKKVDVLIEEKSGNLFTGRTEFDAPEIDGTVYIKAKGILKPGDISMVYITSTSDYDLYGEEVKTTEPSSKKHLTLKGKRARGGW